jgi:hypothetical protein
MQPLELRRFNSPWEEKMNRSVRLFCSVAIAMAAPSIAGAQQATPFDGTYQGVSTTASSGGSACVPATPVPRPLTIRNGTAQFDAGMSGTTVFQGTVSPQGVLTMRDNLADRLDGKIDASGKATGSVHIGDRNCLLTAVWQKQ